MQGRDCRNQRHHIPLDECNTPFPGTHRPRAYERGMVDIEGDEPPYIASKACAQTGPGRIPHRARAEIRCDPIQHDAVVSNVVIPATAHRSIISVDGALDQKAMALLVENCLRNTPPKPPQTRIFIRSVCWVVVRVMFRVLSSVRTVPAAVTRGWKLVASSMPLIAFTVPDAETAGVLVRSVAKVA